MLFEAADPAPGALLVGDLNGDSKAEIVVGSEGDALTVYAYDPIARGLVLLDTMELASPDVSSIASGDPDGDGARELVFGAGVGSGLDELLVVASVAPRLAAEWTNAPDGNVGGPFFGAQLARLAPGRRELLYSSGQKLFALDPSSGGVERSAGDPGRILAVADYDGDGVDEALVAHDAQYSVHDVATGTAEAAVAATYEDVAAGAAGDLLGDDRLDFALLTASGPARLHVLDMLAQSSAAQLTFPGQGRDVAIDDLDGDGGSEIVVATSNAVHVVADTGGGSFGETASYAFDTQVVDVAVGDTNGDGEPEIYVLTDFPHADRIHVLTARLAPRAVLELEAPASSVFIEELGFARRNLAVCNVTSPPSVGFLSVLDAASGALVTRSPYLNGCAATSSLSYFDDESGARRVAMGTPAGMLVTR
jgi:hypothetical protein